MSRCYFPLVLKAGTLLSLFVGFFSASAHAFRCHPIYDHSYSYSAPLLNYSHVPGLPHIAAMRVASHAAFHYLAGSYKANKNSNVPRIVNGNAVDLDSKSLNAKTGKANQVGLDLNTNINFDWGLNVNHTQLSYKRDGKEFYGPFEAKDSRTIMNAAGHLGYWFFYGLGIGQTKCTKLSNPTDIVPIDNVKHGYVEGVELDETGESSPVLLSLGFRLGTFVFGYGVERVDYKVKTSLNFLDAVISSEDSNVHLIQKAGVSWQMLPTDSGHQLQLGLDVSKTTNSSAVTGVGMLGFNVEYGFRSFLVGTYLKEFTFEQTNESLLISESFHSRWSIGYRPWKGAFIFYDQSFYTQITDYNERSNLQSIEEKSMPGVRFGMRF